MQVSKSRHQAAMIRCTGYRVQGYGRIKICEVLVTGVWHKIRGGHVQHSMCSSQQDRAV